MKVSKRPVLLLEVMIAFILIVMSILPLIYPHTYILKAQTRFIRQVELDHFVNLLYADLTEKMYRNEIPWSQLVEGAEFEIGPLDYERLNVARLPFKGIYRFGETKRKPQQDAAFSVHLMRLDFIFTDEGGAIDPRTTDEQEQKLLFKYHYDFMAVHDLGQGPPAEPVEGKPSQEEKPPPEGGAS